MVWVYHELSCTWYIHSPYSMENGPTRFILFLTFGLGSEPWTRDLFIVVLAITGGN